MMNIVKLQDELKNFSQEQLVKEMQAPSGNAPQYLVLGEIMRRKNMESSAAGQQAPQTTVAEEAVVAAGVPQGGIADMARALAPKTDMAQNTGVQAMAKGGHVKKMAEGDIIVRDGLQYEDLIAQARSGIAPTLEQLQSAVEAGLLNGQQAIDIQAMAEGTGYIPTQEDVRAATMPGVTPVPEYTPPMDTPYARATQGIGDFVGGAFGGRTIGEQAAIDAERNATIAAQRSEQTKDLDSNVPGQDTGVPLSTTAGGIETLLPPALATPTTPTIPATPTSPQGGGGTGGLGAISGMSSYEQELINALNRREKAAEQDKWLALAQIGLNLMSSTNPTPLGALGEAGLKGVEALRGSRDQYEKDRLDLMGALQQARASRASAVSRAASGAGSGGARGIKPLSASGIMTQQKYMLDIAESRLSSLTSGQSPAAAAAMLSEAARGGDTAAASQLMALDSAQKQYDSAYDNYMSAAGQLGALTMAEADGDSGVADLSD